MSGDFDRDELERLALSYLGTVPPSQTPQEQLHALNNGAAGAAARFTSFTSTKVQVLASVLAETPQEQLHALNNGAAGATTRFTSFTSTRVRILTREALRSHAA